MNSTRIRVKERKLSKQKKNYKIRGGGYFWMLEEYF